jgi:hypothetical protein
LRISNPKGPGRSNTRPESVIDLNCATSRSETRQLEFCSVPVAGTFEGTLGNAFPGVCHHIPPERREREFRRVSDGSGFAMRWRFKRWQNHASRLLRSVTGGIAGRSVRLCKSYSFRRNPNVSLTARRISVATARLETGAQRNTDFALSLP